MRGRWYSDIQPYIARVISPCVWNCSCVLQLRQTFPCGGFPSSAHKHLPQIFINRASQQWRPREMKVWGSSGHRPSASTFIYILFTIPFLQFKVFTWFVSEKILPLQSDRSFCNIWIHEIESSSPSINSQLWLIHDTMNLLLTKEGIGRITLI